VPTKAISPHVSFSRLAVLPASVNKDRREKNSMRWRIRNNISAGAIEDYADTSGHFFLGAISSMRLALSIRSIICGIVSVLTVSAAVAAPVDQGDDDCPPVDLRVLRSKIDYYDARQRIVNPTARLDTIESNHFNSDVRNLIRGQTVFYPAGDLLFILNIFPNHPGALDALERLSAKERTQRPQGTHLPVKCYLEHAVLFKPTDTRARTIYGIHLARIGETTKAIENLEAAEKADANDANVLYNLGLLYFQRKDYDKSLSYAQRAYQLGFPLPGLKNKLAAIGRWKAK